MEYRHLRKISNGLHLTRIKLPIIMVLLTKMINICKDIQGIFAFSIILRAPRSHSKLKDKEEEKRRRGDEKKRWEGERKKKLIYAYL